MNFLKRLFKRDNQEAKEGSCSHSPAYGALDKQISYLINETNSKFRLVPVYDSAIRHLETQIKGVKGGGLNQGLNYKLLITMELDAYGDLLRMPRTWVLFPSDKQIKHLNIWHTRPPINLPEICYDMYAEIWNQTINRNLLSFVMHTQYILQNENPDNPAR